MKSLKFVGVLEDPNDIEYNSLHYDECCVAVDKTGQLHCYVDGNFIPVCDAGSRPDKAIDYLYNHKGEFTSFKDILDFVYSYSIGQHPDIGMDTLRSMKIMCNL